MKRRDFLKNAAFAAAGAALLPNTLRRAHADAPLPPFVGSLNVNQLVSADTLWEWQNSMVDLGTRLPGSAGHLAYLDFLETQCQQAGLTTFHDPSQYYPLWEADYKQCTLAVASPGDSWTDLEVMSYFPGSGNTNNISGGVLEADVVDAGLGLPEDFAAGIATGSFRGKIAFCTEPPPPVTEALAYPNYYMNDPDNTVTPLTPFNKWSLGIVTPQSLTTPAVAQQAGCSGMIIALEATRKCAYGQYLSFLLTKVNGDQAHGYAGMPILYVDYRTGQYLKSRLQALGGTTKARMRLPSKTTPNTPTDEIVAVLPGSTDENVVIASHTDGTSASEENGPLGMLAMAKYLAQLPERRRTHVFCFATGHFTDGYTKDTAWFTDHHKDIIAKTAATLTIEHLGQKSYTDDPKRDTYTYDGYPELRISYTSQHPILTQTIVANYQMENLTRAPVVNGPGFGVSQAFFNAQLPSYGFITGPNTLYQMDPATVLEGTDKNFMHQEVRTFVRLLTSWEKLSKDQLGAGTAA